LRTVNAAATVWMCSHFTTDSWSSPSTGPTRSSVLDPRTVELMDETASRRPRRTSRREPAHYRPKAVAAEPDAPSRGLSGDETGCGVTDRPLPADGPPEPSPGPLYPSEPADGPRYPAPPGNRTRAPGPHPPYGPQYPAPRQGRNGSSARRPGDYDGPSAAWRLQHSLWLLLPVFNLAWIGFVVTGRMAKKREWLAWAAAYGIVPWGLLAATAAQSGSGALDALAAVAFFTAWAGGTTQGVLINGEYLRRAWAVQTGRPLPGSRTAAIEPPSAATGTGPPSGTGPRSGTGPPEQQTRTVTLSRGPRFPVASADTVTAIDEILQPVLAERRAGKLTEPQRERLDQIVTAYLPQSVEGFLRLPDTFLDQSGRREHYRTVLDQQLGALLDAATTLQTAVFADEADEFEANGRFLRDKFGRSSLDLDQP